MNLHPLPEGSIESIGQAVRDERRTCVDVLNACLARIDEWEPKVNAWVVVDREGAMAQAVDRDRQLREGDDRGPLHGIPFGIKDIVDVAGLSTGAGARHWSDRPAEEDARIVEKLRDAGAVILGKTVTTPYAWVDPPSTRNPWDLDRTPGGSSSGSAVAVACGMCLGAVGTQTGGSLARPASFCGVSSFKPRDGFWTSGGIVPLAPSLDTPGFIARTVQDLRHIWEATVGKRVRLKSGERWNPHNFEEAMRVLSDANMGCGPSRAWSSHRGPENLVFNPKQPPRLGRVRGFFQDLIGPSARVLHEAALVDLAEAGAEIVDVELPEAFGDVHRPHRVVMAAEAASVHSSRMARQPEDYPPKIRALIEEGRSISALDYLQALELRQLLRDEIDWAFSDVHALVVPAALGPAPGRDSTGDPAFNSPWTFTQSPTVSFPIGLSGEGLPLAIQVVGHRFDLPFEVAQWCEAVIRRNRS
jgi:Asp-tRNA(Asn)/Glu-tRNA(Gln) amidotransferase A subunit family amidase